MGKALAAGFRTNEAIDAFLEIGAATLEALGQNHLHPLYLAHQGIHLGQLLACGRLPALRVIELAIS